MNIEIVSFILGLGLGSLITYLIQKNISKGGKW